MLRSTLLEYCNQTLDVERFSDYCPNGLQVEGSEDIKVIVSGVTASEALIQKAISLKADALLVHHGYFWKQESPVVCGMKKRRLFLLLQHNINLLAYHLPLDAHPLLGNNAQLGKRLGFKDIIACDDLVFTATLEAPKSCAELSQHIGQILSREPLLIEPERMHTVKKVAWCTGGAQSYSELAHRKGADVFISGEISEQTVHYARENNIAYISAGHHATERYGVQTLGEKIAKEFDITHHFVDIDNPV